MEKMIEGAIIKELLTNQLKFQIILKFGSRSYKLKVKNVH